MKKNILYFSLFVLFLLSSCANNKQTETSDELSSTMPSNTTSQSVSMDVTQPDFNHQQQPQPSSQITGNASEEQFCKHAQYTLKETYSDYQEALADYNMVLNQYKDHQQDLSCRDHVRSTEKLELDSQKMQKIINELKKLLPPPVLTDQEKLDKIQARIDGSKSDLCMNLSPSDREKTQKMYDQYMELKKQYDSGKITLDECYEKIQEVKYEYPHPPRLLRRAIRNCKKAVSRISRETAFLFILRSVPNSWVLLW